MSVVYVETSALLRLVLEKDPALEPHFAGDLLTSRLTAVEFERALRRRPPGRVPLEEIERMRSRCRKLLRATREFAVDEEVLQIAAGPFPVEPVRSLDAVHLASAMVWNKQVEPVTMLSCDDRVRRNAAALGLGVVP